MFACKLHCFHGMSLIYIYVDRLSISVSVFLKKINFLFLKFHKHCPKIATIAAKMRHTVMIFNTCRDNHLIYVNGKHATNTSKTTITEFPKVIIINQSCLRN